MPHYFDSHVYNPTQAEYASRVILNLIRERRFFLHQTNPNDFRDKDYLLDPKIFRDAILLDQNVRNVYEETKSIAIGSIASSEKGLGISPPDLSNNRQQVVCYRYNGGFEICRVYPLTEFTPFAPTKKEELTQSLLEKKMGSKDADDFSPKQLKSMRAEAESLTEKIWTDFESLQIFDHNNSKCLVLLKSRFICAGCDQNYDFAKSIVADIQNTPFGLGYLFWKSSKKNRIVQHDHVVFNTSRQSHVNVQHWSGGSDPTIQFDAQGGYDSSIVFVTVL